jgi:hypothetical protein
VHVLQAIRCIRLNIKRDCSFYWGAQVEKHFAVYIFYTIVNYTAAKQQQLFPFCQYILFFSAFLRLSAPYAAVGILISDLFCDRPTWMARLVLCDRKSLDKYLFTTDFEEIFHHSNLFFDNFFSCGVSNISYTKFYVFN